MTTPLPPSVVPTGPRLSLRKVGAVATVVGLMAVVSLGALLARPENVHEQPMLVDAAAYPPLPVDLIDRGIERDAFVKELRLRQERPATLLSHPRVEVRLGTYGAKLTLVEARLALEGTACAYVSPPGAKLANNQLVPLVRLEACVDLRGPYSGDLVLSIRHRATGRIAAWTRLLPEASQDRRWIAVRRAVGVPGRQAVLQGRYVDEVRGDSPRRIALLAYLWQVSEGVGWIWSLLALAAGLAIAGAWLLPMHRVERGPPLRHATMASAAGMALLAASLGLAYAVLVPPLQAPDEPDHLLSYAEAVGARSLPDQAAAWAQRGHLERIKFHGDERFRASDVNRPYAVPWGDHVWAEDVRTRSATTLALWTALAWVLEPSTPPHTLLAGRLVNVALFALAIGAGTAIAVAWSAAPYPQLLGLVFLLVPALPFFAMQFSESSVLIAAYLGLAYSIVILFADPPRSHLIGFPLGLAVALALASGRSALPLLPLVAAALAGRAVSGSLSGAHQPAREAGIFWGGFAGGATSLAILASDAYIDGLEALLLTLPAPERFVLALGGTIRWLALPLGAAGFLAECLMARTRRTYDAGSTGRVTALTRGVALASAGALVVILITSGFVDLPHLRALEATPSAVSAPSYALEVVATMLTSLRLGDPDHLLVTSFWVGFGWLDTLPSPMLVSGLVVTSGAMLILLLLTIARARDRRRLVWLMFLGVGWLGSLVAYAVALHVMSFSEGFSRNLHGRYLIGWYLTALAIAWSPMALTDLGRRLGPPARRVSFPGLLLVMAGLIHTYCLWFILRRYF